MQHLSGATIADALMRIGVKGFLLSWLIAFIGATIGVPTIMVLAMVGIFGSAVIAMAPVWLLAIVIGNDLISAITQRARLRTP